MARFTDVPKDVRTVHLGEFTPEHAQQLTDALDGVSIFWWTKDRGFINRIWQLGVEVFVDRARIEDARAIADKILLGSP